MEKNSLPNDEIKVLESWIEISKAISSLYEEMKQLETESKYADAEYQILLRNL